MQKQVPQYQKEKKEVQRSNEEQNPTIDRFLHKRLPKPLPMNLNKIFLLNKVV